MSEQEYLTALKSLFDSDRELADAFAAEYQRDSLADKNTLLTKAKASLGRHEGLQGKASAKNLFPLTSAFDVSESGVRNLIDLRSPSNWTKMSSQALLDAAIKGGYVKPLPESASEEQRQEQRRNFGNFLNILATESTDQERRNVVGDYDKTEFSREPFEWTRKVINDVLFRTYARRAKEQALKGEGASHKWGLDLSADDISTLGTDILANAAYGAGAAGASRLIAGRGLRNAATLYGSDLGAGVVGGAADVLNRAIHTDAGVEPYEYVTEPAVGGIANTLMAPGMLRAGVSNALGFMRGGRVGEFSKRGMMRKAGDWIANRTGWDEAELSRLFQELGGTPDYSTAPLSAKAREKIGKMKEIWDDGLTDSPGETHSLFDELQLLYEESIGDAAPRISKKGEISMEEGEYLPLTSQFLNRLDTRIGELKGELANAAGREDAPALKRRIEYFENARDMFGSGLMDPEKALYKASPEEFVFNNRPTFGAGSGELVDFKDPGAIRDMEIMQEFVDNATHGLSVNAIDHPMAGELARLTEKYPEFGRYVQNMQTVKTPEPIPAFWNNSPRVTGAGLDASMGDRVMYGGTRWRGLSPSRGVLEAAFDPRVAGVGGAAKNVSRSLGEALLTGVGKPAAVVTGKERFNHPDDSFDSVKRKFDELRERKPEATDAAMNWKFDPRLEQGKQLTSEERNLVNRYRAMQLNEAMNGR